MKNKSLLSKEKNITKREKTSFYNYKKLLFPKKSFDGKYIEAKYQF